jgi:hypothetical protein
VIVAGDERREHPDSEIEAIEDYVAPDNHDIDDEPRGL